MTNVLEHQGYAAHIEFDAEDEVFVGHVLGIADRISFHGESVAELADAFHLAIDHYLEDCRATGREPPRAVYSPGTDRQPRPRPTRCNT